MGQPIYRVEINRITGTASVALSHRHQFLIAGIARQVAVSLSAAMYLYAARPWHPSASALRSRGERCEG